MELPLTKHYPNRRENLLVRNPSYPSEKILAGKLFSRMAVRINLHSKEVPLTEDIEGLTSLCLRCQRNVPFSAISVNRDPAERTDPIVPRPVPSSKSIDHLLAGFKAKKLFINLWTWKLPSLPCFKMT